MTVFPDTSNRSISGDFALIDGIIQREPPQLTAHYEFYRHNTDEHLFIDPLIDGTFAMDIITIETQIPTYKTKDSHKIINGTITFGHSRMVDDSCMNASIAAGQWLTYLGDTINYMKNECDEEYTYMDTTKQIEHIQTAITDKMQFYQYQIEKWFKEMIHKCLSWKCL